uniref:Uncharacterized protein n=1 Tax=Fagus sylvatica TaxID=28930 RepID=A0A2N9H5H7_FAGSY
MVTQRSPQRRRDLILKGNNLQTGRDRGRRAQAVAWVSLVQAEIGTGDLQTVGIGDGKPRPWRGSLSSRPRSWGGSLSSRPNQPPPLNRRQAQATTVLQQKTQKAERAKREERAERRESREKREQMRRRERNFRKK